MTLKILNLGCGYVKIKGAVNVDIRQETNPDYVMDLENLEMYRPTLKENSFDKVIALEILEHIKNTGQFLTEIRRVLKPNGILKIKVPYHGVIQNIWFSIFKFEDVFNPTGDHVRFYTLPSIRRVLRDYGFDIIYEELTNSKLFFHEHIIIEAKVLK